MTSRKCIAVALAIMIDGAGLIAHDAQLDAPVVLPPFLVEEHRPGSILSGTDWLYFNSDEFEILSACPGDETEQFIRQLLTQRAAIEEFISSDLLLQSTLPTTLILYPKTQKTEVDEQLLKEVGQLPKDSNHRGHFSPLNDLRLSDPDSSFIFVLLDDWQWGWDIRHGFPKGKGSAVFYSPTYFKFLLDCRIPFLPAWYTLGIERLYELVSVRNAATGLVSSAWTSPLVFQDDPWEGSRLQSDPWLSPSAVASLRENPNAMHPILPMTDLFIPRTTPGKSEAYWRVWEAESELFVRWAYSGQDGGRKKNLERFVTAIATQPISEELFRSCFGFGYSDARDKLSDFLPIAVGKDQELSLAHVPHQSISIGLRTATLGEIHRIKGEWARRTIRVVQSNFPAALPLYIEKARGLLQGSYDKGERDPQLIASLALFKMDIGEIANGRNLLREFPEASASRPLAGIELARIDTNEAFATIGPIGGPLAEDLTARLMQEISEVLLKQPPLEAAYVLAARVQLHRGRDPSADERTWFDSGARLFPRDSQLVMECAAWELRAMNKKAALELIEIGERESADVSTRNRFELLRNLAN